MKTVLTKRLLGFLIKRGYKYCLSQITCIDKHDAYTGITLKPVKKHPNLGKLPRPFQNYYNIIHEPLQMASGIIGTKIWVELSGKDFEKFHSIN